MISHREAKRLADEHLRARSSGLLAASGRRDPRWPVWVVDYLDPARPYEMLVGGALVVTDDGVVHDVGSAPGALDVLMEDLGVARTPWSAGP